MEDIKVTSFETSGGGQDIWQEWWTQSGTEIYPNGNPGMTTAQNTWLMKEGRSIPSVINVTAEWRAFSLFPERNVVSFLVWSGCQVYEDYFTCSNTFNSI